MTLLLLLCLYLLLYFFSSSCLSLIASVFFSMWHSPSLSTFPLSLSLSLPLSLSLAHSLSLILYLCLSFSQRHVLYSSVLCTSVLYASVLYSSLSYSQSLPVEFTIPLCNSPPKRFWYLPIFMLNLLSQRPPVRPPALLICVYEQHLLYLYVSAA